MSTFVKEIQDHLRALTDCQLAKRITESRSALAGADGLKAMAAGLLLGILEEEQKRRNHPPA